MASVDVESGVVQGLWIVVRAGLRQRLLRRQAKAIRGCEMVQMRARFAQ
jgi:hypothetical protein